MIILRQVSVFVFILKVTTGMIVIWAVCVGLALGLGRVIPGGGVIVFSTSDFNDNTDIFVKDLGRSILRVFVSHPGYDLYPTWSPDGEQIAFVSNREGNMEIYIADLTGHNLRRMTNTLGDERYLSWSPDGQNIAFLEINAVEGKSDLNVLNVNGGNLRYLSESIWANGTDGPPAWSPDSREIAFAYLDDSIVEIDVINVDGSNRRPLTGINTAFPSAVAGIIHSPAWSPDGGQIAFVGYPDYGWDYELYVINVDGTNLRQLTEDNSGWLDQQPAWSPDGEQIVFISNREGKMKIYIIDPDGTNLRRVAVSDRVEYQSPGWMP
jgi:Tol biopolymer transport system component